ncbi:hypothetical protein [Negadavirga shengliensis]|uniref:DUF4249 domain-containing protein n=1 Tax=Negadavirga shengliensis TaxID=1389218 RepID=A0ABV9T2S8_9BACT
MNLTAKNIKTLVLVLSLISLFACDRTFDMETISVTPPELHIYVTESGSPISGATVNLYKNASDRENGTNAVTKSADGLGLAIFEMSELAEPGVFFLSAEFEGTVVEAETPYLLLNDGHTRFEIDF